MRTNGGTMAPLGEVKARACPRAAAPSVSPSPSSFRNPRLPQEELKSPIISMWLAPVALTMRLAAASADRVSVQDEGSGASVWNTRTGIGPLGSHMVASTREYIP